MTVAIDPPRGRDAPDMGRPDPGAGGWPSPAQGEIADLFLYRGAGHHAGPRGLDRRAWRAGQGRHDRPRQCRAGQADGQRHRQRLRRRDRRTDRPARFSPRDQVENRRGQPAVGQPTWPARTAATSCWSGAGIVARTMVEAYSSAFSEAPTSPSGAAPPPPPKPWACPSPPILRPPCAPPTSSAPPRWRPNPLIKGDWLQPGQHLDLIGAYTPPCARWTTPPWPVPASSSMPARPPSTTSAS